MRDLIGRERAVIGVVTAVVAAAWCIPRTV